jgi:hypothetical protein
MARIHPDFDLDSEVAHVCGVGMEYRITTQLHDDGPPTYRVFGASGDAIMPAIDPPSDQLQDLLTWIGGIVQTQILVECYDEVDWA